VIVWNGLETGLHSLSMGKSRRRGDSGQSAVETALVLPLVTFMILGTLQLFMLLQAKIMAQYAVFQAARVGSTTYGRCDAMMHAALLPLIPTFHNYLGTGALEAGSPGTRLGLAFQNWSNNDYGGTLGTPFRNFTGDSIIWLARDRPNFAAGLDNPNTARQFFDVPLDPLSLATPTHLELKMVYWAPLQIPFADWVFSKLALASMGLASYGAGNPLMETQNANWAAGTTIWSMTGTQAPMAAELLLRDNAGRYVFPILVTYSMRMMSPVKVSDFATQNCGVTPPAFQ
jgi:hypothetical protein